MTTTNYRSASIHADRVQANQPTRAAEIRAILAIADELRAIKELLERVTGAIGGTGGDISSFIRVFDEAP